MGWCEAGLHAMFAVLEISLTFILPRFLDDLPLKWSQCSYRNFLVNVKKEQLTNFMPVLRNQSTWTKFSTQGLAAFAGAARNPVKLYSHTQLLMNSEWLMVQNTTKHYKTDFLTNAFQSLSDQNDDKSQVNKNWLSFSTHLATDYVCGTVISACFR